MHFRSIVQTFTGCVESCSPHSGSLTRDLTSLSILSVEDENYGPIGSYTDKGRIREALAAAVAMGATTIRSHSCGISVGPNNPYQLEPSWNNFNDAAVRHFALTACQPAKADNHDRS